MMPQIGAPVTDDTRSVIYNCNMFIIQATEQHSPEQPFADQQSAQWHSSK
jgi:hypothetical protein